ncbi:MAG: OmpP1/FadL family transporter [Phycisphaerae bacterium]
MLWKNFLCAAAAAGLVAMACDQAIATNGYQLIGIGQYQMGMAGAVVADPGDPMTAITNPAGLAWIQPQAAFSMEGFFPNRDANFGAGTIGSHSNLYGVPALGWLAPAFGPHLYFGGGFYGTSGMGVNYQQSNYFGGSLESYSNISFANVAPALAWKPAKNWSVGFALNLAYETASFQQTVTTGNTISGLNLGNSTSAFGIGCTIGGMYKLNKYVTLGLSYRSPIIFTPLTYQASYESLAAQGGPTGGPGQYSTHLDYPEQVALGVAFHPTSRWTISVEGQWINWHETMNNLNIYGPWNGTSHVSLPLHWHDEGVANFGTQYRINKFLTVRGGYCYGSNPIGSQDLASNLILPAIMGSHITIGATEQLGMGWTVTEAYMHAFQQSMSGTMDLGGQSIPISTTMSEDEVGVEIGYKF